MQTQVSRTTLAIDTETFKALADVARRNERSASAEARLAIRTHILTADAVDKPLPSSERQGGRGAAGAHSLAVRGRSSARSAGRAHEQGPGHGSAAD